LRTVFRHQAGTEPTGDIDVTSTPDDPTTRNSVVTPEPAAAPPASTTSTPSGSDAAAPKRGMGTTAVVVSVIAALAIGGIVGIAIGWKVEQQRVKDDVKNIRPVATVTAVDDNSLQVALRSATGNRTYVITGATKVDAAADGSADIAQGDLVIVKSKKVNGKLQATEVVILPKDTTFGN
jgi:uncharacterized protein HemX